MEFHRVIGTLLVSNLQKVRVQNVLYIIRLITDYRLVSVSCCYPRVCRSRSVSLDDRENGRL